jgi:hypothetical protein
MTKQMEEALSGLMYGIQTRKGFVTLTVKSVPAKRRY